jgi:hypothetical protein
LIRFFKDGKETYRSDLIEFIVPSKELMDENSIEFISVSHEPIPHNLPGIDCRGVSITGGGAIFGNFVFFCRYLPQIFKNFRKNC